MHARKHTYESTDRLANIYAINRNQGNKLEAIVRTETSQLLRKRGNLGLSIFDEL